MQARAVFKAVPRATTSIIKGNEADANARFLRGGYEEIIGDAVKSGDIKIVGETYTDDWEPGIAQTEMEQFLTANNNKVDAVLSENDGMAGGVVAALDGPGPRRQGARSRARTATPPPSTASPSARRPSTSGRTPAMLGKAAGEAAVQLCKGTTVDKVAGTAPVHDARGQHRHARSCSSRCRSPRTTSTSSSTPGGSPRTRCARA